MDHQNWTPIYNIILEMEQQGRVTRTFRRLDLDRQQAIIGAILDEAAESGPATLNIKHVAERAGVAVGSLYQYFGSRQGLIDFAVDLVVAVTSQQFLAWKDMLAAMPLREALSAYISGGMEWSEAEAAYARFFARAAYAGEEEFTGRVVVPIATTLRDMVHEMVIHAAARGEIRPGVDLEAAARVLHALTIATSDPIILPYLNAYFQLTDETMPPERILEAMLDLIYRGIGAEESKLQ